MADEKKVKPQLEVRFDQDRLEEYVSVDTLVEAEAQTLRGMRDLVSCFVIGEDGDYLTQEEGLKKIGPLSLRQLQNVSTQLLDLSLQSAEADEETEKN